MALKVLIVDDDAKMRQILKWTLAPINGVEIAGEAVNGTEAVSFTEQLLPNVIFMDIELPDKSGVEAINEILDIIPDIFIIFATGHPEYMSEAFELYAFDYLLKPYKTERILQTIAKIRDLIESRTKNLSVNLNTITKSDSLKNKVAIRIDRNLNLIDTTKITYINREKRKTLIHMEKGKIIHTNESLDTLENRLKESSIIRTHRSYLVNLDKVTEIQPWSRSAYLVVFAGLKEVAYMTEEKYRQLQEQLY